MVSIPFSRNKHYLTGIDWLVQGIDRMNERATGAGHMFQIVMELGGVPAESRVRESLDGLIRSTPMLRGRTSRDYNLAPYWKLSSTGQKHPMACGLHHLRDGEDVLPVLEAAINTPFGSRREHLALQLVCQTEKSHAAVKFDHSLFDAHGAEAFLGHFNREWEGRGPRALELLPAEPAHLSDWRGKFEAGRQVNRALRRLAENGPPRALPVAARAARREFRFRVVSFTERQTAEVIERAEAEAGYLMAMPYTMALTVQVLHRVFLERRMAVGDYVIPVTMDTRPRSGRAQDLFFNHVSFLLFRIQARDVEDFPVLLESIKRQMYDQVRAGLPRDIEDASLLMRIAPLSIVSRLLKLYLKGGLASFCFSFLGESGHMPTQFMGEKVERSYHMTRVPVPPGLGVFFQRAHGRLNAYLSYLQGLLAEDEADAVLETLRSRLEG